MIAYPPVPDVPARPPKVDSEPNYPTTDEGDPGSILDEPPLWVLHLNMVDNSPTSL
jgi:hypothetical protein